MKYISAQPDSDYFVWQIRVQMNNFKKLGIENDSIILFSYNMSDGINPNAQALLNDTTATVIFYPDQREGDVRKYISTIRPFLLKMFFQTVGKDLIGNDGFFYHDSDIIFTSLPSFKTLMKKGKVILSDTVSYIGANYIKSKGDGLLDEMCSIVGIDPQLVIKNEKKSGGAQYLISKNVHMTYEFWDKVEKDSSKLYQHMISTSNKYTPQHPIQAWTADMWALLWNFWVMGYDTTISKELEFTWATSLIEDWSKHCIYHNAGATADRKDLFFKGAFIDKTPFDISHDYVSDKFCSFKYVEEIIETGKSLNSNR